MVNTENLNNDELINLVKNNISSLTKLNLSRRNMAAANAADLAKALEQNTHLAELDISHNSAITDEMFQPLLPGIQKSNLKYLDITGLELLSPKTRNELKKICEEKGIELKEEPKPEIKPFG